jgi:predicted O-linked N-acetylglucosamine transferase (SPINDLY family)
MRARTYRTGRERVKDGTDDVPVAVERAIARATKLLLHGDGRGARRVLRPALRRYPDSGELQARCGDALYLQERLTQAREAYQRALSLDDTIFQAWYGLGCTEFSAGAYAAAIESFRRAVALEPGDGDARMYLGRSLFHMGQVDEAIDELQVVARTAQSDLRRKALCQIATIIPGSPKSGNAEVMKSRVAWARREAPYERSAGKMPARTRAHSPGEKIRIGYVSAFFGSRNWMKPVWGFINEHDRSSFEIHLFWDVQNPALANEYRRHARDSIHGINGLSNEEAARRIRKAGLDILVDLNGYSFPQRLGMFMRKPAAIQFALFAMYATTGIRAYDYIVSDMAALPVAEERFCTERVLRVSGSYLAFRVQYPVPRVVPPPCVEKGFVTFGCLAPQYKITDGVIATWAQILIRAPSSRLILKSNCLEQPSNRAAVLARFARFGVGPGRVALEPPAEHFTFLKTYGRIDIALDTFPYNGGTTTMESLWQGVPVLTFNGDRWASRTSRTLVLAAGLEEWDLPSREEFVEKAIALANSPETPAKLAALRSGMRERLLDSRACDSQGLRRELEQHYKNTYRPNRTPATR